MSGETNRLLKLVNEISKPPSERESDVIVATGEQVTRGPGLARHPGGRAARRAVFLGHQVRIVTDSAFSKARIKSIDAEKIYEALKKGEIAVVAGFQGTDEDGNITTLGRGGSDTTGVAIAAALKADVCEIYTDVDGVYTTDPNICPNARKIDRISYEEMLELASLGAKVLQIRSVEFGMKYRVPIWVKSSFTDDPGTLVSEEEADGGRARLGDRLRQERGEDRSSRVPDKPGMAAKIFGPLSEANIVVDMIIQNVSRTADGPDLHGAARDLTKATDIVKKVAKAVKAHGIETDDEHRQGLDRRAWACATTPAWPRRSSRCWRGKASTSS